MTVILSNKVWQRCLSSAASIHADSSRLVKELEIRARQKHTKMRKASKLPNKAFDASNSNKGLKWQIKQLSNLTWLKEEQNLILLGKCGTGKTGLAAQLGETAISNGYKTYYAPFDNFIAVAEKKATNPKAEAIFSYMQECDLIIIDDVFYVEPTRAELQVFYRAVTFLNETRSIIFICGYPCCSLKAFI